MKVKAAVVRETGGNFDIAELDLDDPRDDEILVRVKGVGLCHTDLIARDGMMPFAPPAVLGHEGSGIVERVGAKVRKVKRGDAVGITFRSCGVCPRCKRGDPAYCHTMPQLNYAGMRPDGSKALHENGADVTAWLRRSNRRGRHNAFARLRERLDIAGVGRGCRGLERRDGRGRSGMRHDHRG